MNIRRWLPVLLLSGCASLPQPASMTVLVYNIHAGKDADQQDNLERVAAVIKTAGADLVLLQEVDRNTTRSGQIDQLAVLQRLTGMQAAFGKSLDYQGGLYGIATLSRWPIRAQRVVPLQVVPVQTRAGGSLEPRVALVIEVTGPNGRFIVVNTHLDASREQTFRLQEVTRLLEQLKSEDRRPMLLGGDFNAEPDSSVYSSVTAANLTDSYATCGSGGDGFTFPASSPIKRIDYLFTRNVQRCASANVLDSNASDHRPVLIRFAAK